MLVIYALLTRGGFFLSHSDFGGPHHARGHVQDKLNFRVFVFVAGLDFLCPSRWRAEMYLSYEPKWKEHKFCQEIAKTRFEVIQHLHGFKFPLSPSLRILNRSSPSLECRTWKFKMCVGETLLLLNSTISIFPPKHLITPSSFALSHNVKIIPSRQLSVSTRYDSSRPLDEAINPHPEPP